MNNAHMDVEVRSIRSDEYEPFIRAMKLGFGDHTTEDDIHQSKEKGFEPDRAIAAFHEGKIVGTTDSFPVEIAVPGHDVQRAVIPFGGPESALEFLDHQGRFIDVLEGGDGAFEVARVGQAVRADGAAMGQVELLAIVLADEAAAGAFEHLDPVDEAAGDHGDLLWRQVDHTEFGREAQPPLLRHPQQFAVG